ncbi:hypothetical protein GMRT_14251 [Giardia muris]|uniref:Uncharacterized protein n=1 Tax=Giardia muris TaxID=5742 RepID=A0A4Z1T3J2_GIAMU|nr:hypothetical protein GMRT_14251 [Giardia muris]|eukprot:TNJ30208.1 hypothetical protein GMRT_14251 [Giardia muris]
MSIDGKADFLKTASRLRMHGLAAEVISLNTYADILTRYQQDTGELDALTQRLEAYDQLLEVLLTRSLDSLSASTPTEEPTIKAPVLNDNFLRGLCYATMLRIEDQKVSEITDHNESYRIATALITAAAAKTGLKLFSGGLTKIHAELEALRAEYFKDEVLLCEEEQLPRILAGTYAESAIERHTPLLSEADIISLTSLPPVADRPTVTQEQLRDAVLQFAALLQDKSGADATTKGTHIPSSSGTNDAQLESLEEEIRQAEAAVKRIKMAQAHQAFQPITCSIRQSFDATRQESGQVTEQKGTSDQDDDDLMIDYDSLSQGIDGLTTDARGLVEDVTEAVQILKGMMSEAPNDRFLESPALNTTCKNLHKLSEIQTRLTTLSSRLEQALKLAEKVSDEQYAELYTSAIGDFSSADVLLLRLHTFTKQMSERLTNRLIDLTTTEFVQAIRSDDLQATMQKLLETETIIRERLSCLQTLVHKADSQTHDLLKKQGKDLNVTIQSRIERHIRHISEDIDRLRAGTLSDDCDRLFSAVDNYATDGTKHQLLQIELAALQDSVSSQPQDRDALLKLTRHRKCHQCNVNSWIYCKPSNGTLVCNDCKPANESDWIHVQTQNN